jgi:B12 binding domain
MRVLFIHPGPLLYSEIFLRLEPLGLERVASAARLAGHDVRALDLQVSSRSELEAELRSFRPEAVGFGLNYLANVPEVLDLAAEVKRCLADCFTFAGGHSVSFIAPHVLEQADGALDAIVRGDGEVIIPLLLEATPDGAAHELPGVVTRAGQGKGPPLMLDSIDDCPPARDLMRNRRKYFIGELDPCARSSSHAAVPGTAPSARRGPSTAAPTARPRLRRRQPNFSPSASRTCSSSTTFRSSGLIMARQSPEKSSGDGLARATTSKPGPMCCFATLTSSSGGGAWA